MPSRGKGHRQTALTVIEIIIVLAVLVAMIALVVPSAVQRLTAARRTGTLNEMENVKLGMIGDANLKIKGVRSDFAYLGDMGNLPSTLDDLVTQGAQPAYAFDSSKQVGAGWKGPYVTVGVGGDSSSHKRDAFGNDYTYDTTDYTNGQGQAVDGKLVTFGADGVTGGTGENEDVTLEMLKAETTATVSGSAFDQGGNPLNGAGVSIHFPAAGVLTSSTITADSSGFYQFTDIPIGDRSITLEPRLLLVAGSVSAFGGSNQDVEFRVVNFSSSPVTVRSIIASYDTAVFYNLVRWGTPFTTVFDCSGLPKASGDTTIFSADETVAAGGAPMPPVMVPVTGSFVQLTDITVQGSGTEATVQLQSFRDNGAACNSGSFVNMSGTNFTDVQLLDPSSAIVGQFSFTVP